jgi:hypothetical protein
MDANDKDALENYKVGSLNIPTSPAAISPQILI